MKVRAYIDAIKSITRTTSFNENNLYSSLQKGTLKIHENLIEPQYKDYLSGGTLRRTPKINKMALACSLELLKETAPLQGIIVGTGLGCLAETEKYGQTVLKAQEGQLIAPLAFINSGHNAIAGQIALQLKTDVYNMTHVQGYLSFEHALLDAMLLIEEGSQHILVGAVDENTWLLDSLNELREQQKDLGEGASFCSLSSHSKSNSNVFLQACDTIPKAIFNLEDYLKNNQLSIEDETMFFVSNENTINSFVEDRQIINYLKLTGWYYGCSGFGFHLAHDYSKENHSTAVVLNDLDSEYIGITVLRHD